MDQPAAFKTQSDEEIAAWNDAFKRAMMGIVASGPLGPAGGEMFAAYRSGEDQATLNNVLDGYAAIAAGLADRELIYRRSRHSRIDLATGPIARA